MIHGQKCRCHKGLDECGLEDLRVQKETVGGLIWTVMCRTSLEWYRRDRSDKLSARGPKMASTYLRANDVINALVTPPSTQHARCRQEMRKPP